MTGREDINNQRKTFNKPRSSIDIDSTLANNFKVSKNNV